jgi:hypothetical protein
VAKLIVYCISARRKHLLESIEIRSKRNDESERELRLREREVDAYHKETEMIKDFNLDFTPKTGK